MKTRPPTPVRVATTTAYPTAGKGASAERHIFSAPYTPCMNFRAPYKKVLRMPLREDLAGSSRPILRATYMRSVCVYDISS
jgi:hypothetical protein